MKMAGIMISFMAGAAFGVMTMCLMVTSSREDEREVMRFAGGSGKQDSEPRDQHDEAHDADGGLGSADVPAAQEGSGGAEA